MTSPKNVCKVHRRGLREKVLLQGGEEFVVDRAVFRRRELQLDVDIDCRSCGTVTINSEVPRSFGSRLRARTNLGVRSTVAAGDGSRGLEIPNRSEGLERSDNETECALRYGRMRREVVTKGFVVLAVRVGYVRNRSP